MAVIRSRRIGDRASVIELTHRRVPQVPAHRVARLLDSHLAEFRVDLVGECAKGLSAWASTIERPEDPTLMFGRVVVAAEEEGRGLGGQLHARLVADLPDQTRFLRGVIIESDHRALEVAQHWGYEAYELGHVSRLDLQDLPEPRLLLGVSFDACPRLRFADEGAVAAMLDRAETNPERMHGIFRNLHLLREVASSGTPVGFLARVGSDPVGLVHGLMNEDQMLISLLCVDPGYRGRGIALALKERFHHMGRRLGATHVLTANEDTNVAIRNLNARMGYLRRHGEVRVQRPLR